MTRTSGILVLALALASGCAAAADAGRVILSAGDATALRQGQVIRLDLGTPVQDQDVLRTGPASNLQVRFEDDSYVSLREGSELKVDRYRYSGGKDADESAVFSLIKGGLRAVTGLIGRRNHDNYSLSTPTATIGIRGTDYAATLCQGDCNNPDGSKAEDGLYGRVIGQSNGTNEVTVTNKSGPPATLGINSNFYVKDINSGVRLLLLSPDFVLSKLESRGRSASAGSSGGSGSEQASSGGASDESRPSTVPAPLPPLQFVVTQDLGPQGGPSVLVAQPNGFAVAFPGMPGMSGDAFFDDDQTIGTYNAQGQLVSLTDGVHTASLAGGTIVDQGSFTFAGQNYVWGRWTGPTSIPLFNGSTYVDTANVPLLFFTATIPDKEQGSVVGKLGGVATYAYVGGPRPVDGGGNVGSITSTSMTINFTTLQQSLSLGMSFPSVLVGSSNMGPAAFSLTGSGSATPNGNGEFGGALSGSCSGGGCQTPSPTGFFITGLTGPNGYEIAPVSGLVDGTKAGEVAFLNAYQLSSLTPGPAPVNVTGQVAWANATPSAVNTATLGGGPVTLSGNNLVAFGDGVTFPSGTLGAGSILETGSVSLVDGSTMNWGRWSSASQVVSSPGNVTINPATGVAFVLGTNPSASLPTSGTFTYTYAGGPNPVNASGTVGTFGGGAFNIAFGSTSGAVTVSTPLTFSIGSFNYALTSCASGCTIPNSNGVAGNMNLTGTCTGSCGPTASSSLAGVLVGPQQGGFAVAGNVFATSTPAATIAGAFKR